MLVVFRCDASSTIGTGHVMRCMALGEMLRQRGACIRFLMRRGDRDLTTKILRLGFSLSYLPVAEKAFSNGLDWENDLAATEEFIAATGRPDWLIIDRYGLSDAWETGMRPYVDRIMVIDDHVDVAHDCDVILNQNVDAESERYRGLVPRRARVLTGPRYALLRREFEQARSFSVQRRTPPRSVLVSYGGGNVETVTRRTLVVLSSTLISADLSVHTAMMSEAETFSEWMQAGLQHELHIGTDDIPSLIAGSDVAFGGGGVMALERLYLSLPAVCLTIADNQRESLAWLDSRGLVRWLGDIETVDDDTLRSAVQNVLSAGGLDWFDRERAEELFGHGRFPTAAVCDVLMERVC